MVVQALEYGYKDIKLFRQWEEQALAVNSQKYLPAKEWSEIWLHFYDTYINYYIFKIYYLFVAAAPRHSMSITLIIKANIILQVLAKLIKNSHSKQYLFQFSVCGSSPRISSPRRY